MSFRASQRRSAGEVFSRSRIVESRITLADIKTAFDGEIGEDWLESQPLKIRVFYQFLRIYTTMIALYFFLVALSLMGDSFTALTGKNTGSLFTGVNNPIVGLMVGIIATVLLQSSSTTTSIIVVLVGNGVLDTSDAVPMIMGSNIGTSVTSTIVSLGFADDPEAYERGFAGATVHDMFNYLNVMFFLPFELLTSSIFNKGNGGFLQIVSESISDSRGESELDGGDSFEDSNPIKKITNPILDFLIEINKDVVSDHAIEFPGALEDNEACEDISFEFQTEETAADEFGCPDFVCDFCAGGAFNLTLHTTAKEAFDSQDLISGGILEGIGDFGGGMVALILSLVVLLSSLAVVVRMLSLLARGAAQKFLRKSLNHNYVGGNYVSILIGCAITFVVQSSSITTSILTPLVATGSLDLEKMFPYTLGANIGTTGTGLIAAAADGDPNSYTIALVHLFFNIFGTLLWYPIPRVRAIPINAARFLGSMAAIWKLVPIIYIVFAFLIYPLIVFGLSAGFTSGNGGGIAVSTIFLIILVAAHSYIIYFYKFKDGKAKFKEFVRKRQERIEQKRLEKEGTVPASKPTINEEEEEAEEL